NFSGVRLCPYQVAVNIQRHFSRFAIVRTGQMHPSSNSWLILSLGKTVKTHLIAYQGKMPLVMKNVIFLSVTKIVLIRVRCFFPLTLHNCDVPRWRWVLFSLADHRTTKQPLGQPDCSFPFALNI